MSITAARLPSSRPVIAPNEPPADPTVLSNDRLEAEVAALSAQLDAAEHRLLTLIRELDRRERHRDHGLPSLVAWLSWRVGLGPVAAREKVRVAKALGELPQIDLAFSRAEISYSKVRALTRVAMPGTEAKLLHMARHGSAAQLETICRGVEQVSGMSAEVGRIARWVKLKPCKDGMVRLEIRVHADEAALVMKAIDAAVEEGRGADASAEAPEPARSSRADGLLRVADAFLAGQRPEGRAGGERHQLLVCIKESVLHPGGVSAEAEAGLAVAPDTLRRLACDASVTRITVTDEGAPLDVGRKNRTVPPALRRALVARDGGCRFPGCTNHRWVDAHHIEHWVDGGTTRSGNLILLCTTHHRLVHEGGFRLGGSADDPRFERPDGTSDLRADLHERECSDATAGECAAPAVHGVAELPLGDRRRAATRGLSAQLGRRLGARSQVRLDTFDTIEEEIMFSRGALKANDDARDLLTETDEWLPLLGGAVGRQTFREKDMDGTAGRAIANVRLGIVCLAFGKDLLHAVGADRKSPRFTGFFPVAPWRFEKQTFDKQILGGEGVAHGRRRATVCSTPIASA